MTELEKLQRYCAYQERCKGDIEKKMNSLGILPELQKKYLQLLINEGFLNEERFVESFVRGKFHYKKWGKSKIIFHLKQKGVSDNSIQKGINQIEEQEYYNVMLKLVEKKRKELSSENDEYLIKQKIYRFLLQKGFRADEINKLFSAST